ncbi:hypothetical protein H0H81_000549, partial [Sphagnurus paluster]
AKIILALCVLHNFICIHDPDDLMSEDELKQRDKELNSRPQKCGAEEYGNFVSEEEQKQAADLCDKIAKAMWEQYQITLVERDKE